MKTTPTVRLSTLTPPRARYQPKSQSSLFDAEALNKRAIAFLRTHQTKEALQCFKQGLSVLHEITRQDDTISAGSECSIVSQSIPLLDVSEDVLVSPSGVFVFFQRVMQFSKGASPDVCATVFLYNVALLHHRQAIQMNSTSMYRKTLQLYQLCQRTLLSSDIMQFAIMNNVGHILDHLFIDSAAQACQDWLVYNRACLLPLLDSMAEEFVLLGPQRSCAAAMA